VRGINILLSDPVEMRAAKAGPVSRKLEADFEDCVLATNNSQP
jgi:hypothetical protein